MSRIFLLLAVVLSAGAVDEFPKQRLDLDPSLCGLWMAYATSTDHGKTTEHINPPVALARATPGTLHLGRAPERITQVLVTKNSVGILGNAVQLGDESIVIYIGDVDPETGLHLVQLFRKTIAATTEEVQRWVIRIE